MGEKIKSEEKDVILEAYCKEVKAFPLLNFEEELELAKKIQKGNAEALHKLVNSNLRLVMKIAGDYCASDVSLMDLIQEGNMGLMHAAEKYDPRKKIRFSTYASWWIRQFVSRYLSNKRRIVRLPHRKEEMLRKIQRSYHTLSQDLMHQPGNADIAKAVGIPLKDVDLILSMTADPLSLETDPGENANVTLETHEDYTYSPEQSLMRKVSHAGIMRILSKLKDKEQRVLNYRYQLDGGERHTLRETGNKLDLSPETVRQIEQRALRKIRSHANELRECVFAGAI